MIHYLLFSIKKTMFLKSLKVFLILAIFFSYSHAQKRILVIPKEVGDFIRATMKNCTSDEALISSSLQSMPKGEYEENEAFKQLVYCSYINTNFAHKNGRVNIEAASSVFPDDIEFKKALENCDKPGSNPVETNWSFYKCFQDTSPVLLQV